MPAPVLEPETVRRMASEVVKIALVPADVEPVRAMLESLLTEIGQIMPAVRAGAEPETTIVVEEWSR